MAMNQHEPRMIEEVRRWRREVYEERRTQTPQERAEDERRVIESLGLTRLVRKNHADTVRPDTRKRVG